jgi:hypothetical protein
MDGGDDRGSPERARKGEAGRRQSTTHMLAGTGAVVAGEGSTWTLFGRRPTRDCDGMRVRRENPTNKFQRSYDDSEGRRMKWLEMFDWKGNCSDLGLLII